MGSTHKFLNQPKFVCACLFLLVGQTLASVKRVEDTASNDISSGSVGSQNEAQTLAHIERIPAVRDSSGDIVIESFDDGLLSASSAKNSNNRHHYEPPAMAAATDQQQQQQVQQTSPNPTIPAPAPAASASSTSIQEDSAPASANSKPEPRNHQEDQQPETVIIDHRPSGPLEQSPPGAVHTTSTAASGATGADYSNQSGGQHNNHNSQQQQPPAANQVAVSAQATGSTLRQAQGNQQQVATSNQPMTGWYSAANSYQSASQPQFSQQQVGGLQGGNYAGSMIVSGTQVQHPTSINSIISDQQNQGQLGNMAMPQAQASGQAQVMSLNGQPVYLVNPGVQGSLGGRRVSISNWLKGISSMLASIFNRREHGNPLMSGQASSQAGHWIQLGPNAPHWLTQAQSLIQQQQQQFQQQFGTIASNNNNINNNPSQQQQQLIGSASTNRYPTYVQAPQMISQQQLPLPINVQPSAILSGQAQHQVMPASYGVSSSPPSQNNADLQASSSSNNYVAVQHLPSQQQNQQFNTQANNLVQYQPTSSAATPSGAGQSSVQSQSSQPQLVQASPAGRQSALAANVEQPRQASSIATGQQLNTGSGSQASITWSPAAPPPQSTSNIVASNSARFSRSSPLSSASQNLPLAHYSHYAVSSE